MKKIVLILLSAAVITCKSSTNTLRPEGIFKNKAEEITALPKSTPESVAVLMNFLASDELEGRKVGAKGIEKAADYIEDFFKTHTISPYFSSYKDSLSATEKTAYNIVGFIPGSDRRLKSEYIVVGAHYDHIGLAEPGSEDRIFNGANDNASGTIAVLEAAKYFAYTHTNKRSMLFVLFSAEEEGLLGSKHLARKLKSNDFNLYAMVNFEMIGVPMNTPHKAYITGYNKSNMAAKINDYTGKNSIGFLPTAEQYQLFMRSDNYPFYLEFGAPSQTISTFDFTNFNYYHHVDDEVTQMNVEHIAALINEIIPALEKMAGTPTREIKMND